MQLSKKSRLTIFRTIVGFLFRSLTKIECRGSDNIPDERAAILALNHLSRLDSPLILILTNRVDISGLVAVDYRNNPFTRWLINWIGGIWINREEADFQALKEAKRYLDNGGLLGIAPEGTRSKTKSLQPGKTGIAFLAEKTKVPIIPVAISGTEKIFTELSHLRRPEIKIQFGEAFHVEQISRSQRDASLKKNTDEIMCRIAVMLPEAYRGVYKHHPKLEELLKSD